MPKQIKKGDLPSKSCLTCGKSFIWRKKWEKVWNEVKYCSEKCRRNRHASKMAPTCKSK